MPQRHRSRIRPRPKWLLTSTALVWLSSASLAVADDEDKARIAKLEAAVAALQARLEAQDGLAAENVRLRGQNEALQARASANAQSPKPSTIVLGSQPSPPSASNAPVVASTFNDGEPGIATADGRFSLNLYALVQLEGGIYDQAAAGPILTDHRRSGPALGYSAANVDFAHARDLKDGDDFRRARFGVSGSAFGDLDYRVLFDFGGSGVENAGQLYEAWTQYTGLKPLRIRVGAFAPQEGLADQDSAAAQPFLERPASADIARSFAGGETRTAAQFFAYEQRWLASLAVTGRTVGVINSAATGAAQTYGDPLAFVGRIAGTPLRGSDWLLHLGAHGQYLETPADASGPPNAAPTAASTLARYSVAFSDQAELRIDGTKLINTGAIDARHASTAGLEAAAQWRGFLVQSEYDHLAVERRAVGVTDPHFDGWYVEGSWVLTGGSRRYNSATAAFDAPPVRSPVGQGGIGAVELAFRYADMNLNYHAGALGSAPAPDAIRGGELKTWSASVNWYPNPYVRLALEGQHVNIDRLSPDALTYQTPIGVQVGQSFNAISALSQFGF